MTDIEYNSGIRCIAAVLHRAALDFYNPRFKTDTIKFYENGTADFYLGIIGCKTLTGKGILKNLKGGCKKMAVLKKEEFIEKISKIIGDENSDENLGLLEDITDTFDSFSNNENWKEKYENNDKEWREKYRKRFETPSEKKDEESEEETGEKEEKEKTTFDDLFKF